ncbi:MAG: hypothetical protein FWG74_08570, partial [Planctomycetes bacterium]|nr:hypothetical protein [Planctomycetota bacterium]
VWLALFRAETEEELRQIEALEVPIMEQAIEAYRSITAASEFREMERLYRKARHDEAQALYNAKLEGAREGAREADEKWQGVVESVVAEKDAALTEKDAALAEKDAALADRNAENARLREQIAELQARQAEGK